MPLKLTERDVARQVRDFLEAHGWRAIRMQVASVARPTGGGFHVGEVGMPDYLFLRYEGDIPATAKHDYSEFEPNPLQAACQHLWVETKAPGKKRKPHQQTWARDERLRGAVVVEVNDFDQFLAWYREEFVC